MMTIGSLFICNSYGYMGFDSQSIWADLPGFHTRFHSGEGDFGGKHVRWEYLTASI